MADDGGASSNAEEFAEQLRERIEAYRKDLEGKVFGALTLVESSILQNLRSNSGLHVRTGALLNSIGASKRVYRDADGNVVGEIGSQGIPYARIHEFGGTIVPKNARALTIPTEENRRPDGLPKYTIDDLKRSGIPIFVAKGTLFAVFQRTRRTKGGMMGVGGMGQITPMFLLRSSVNIPARPYLRPAIAANEKKIIEEFGLFITAAFPSST